MGLLNKAYRGAGWSGLSGIFSNGLELLKYIIVARFLNPSDFGLLAMALVVISISRIFADGGTSNAVIHFRNQSARHLSTLFWVNILAGSTLYGIIFFLSPFIALFFGEPEVSRLLKIGGVVLPIYAAGALYEALLRKSLSFRYIAVSESTGALIGFVTAVALAWAGWGVYALIYSQIATAATLTGFYLLQGLQKWKPVFCFEPLEIWPHLTFGFYQMGERALNIFSTRVDQLVIGKFFGPEILGAYFIAYRLVLFPVSRLSPLLNRVALPIFSSRQNQDPILRNGYFKLLNGIIMLFVPFLVLTGLTAPWLVPLLFGSGWDLSIQLIPLMAGIGFLKMLGNPSGNIVLAKGRARLVFFWNLGTAVASTVVILVGAFYSIYTLVWLYFAINAVYFGLGQWIMVHRLIDLSWTRFFQELSPVFFVAGAAWLATWIYRNLASGIWHFDGMLSGSNTLHLMAANLFGAWLEPDLWYKQALFDVPGMVASTVAVFFIIYFVLLWLFRYDVIREAADAFRNTGNKETGDEETYDDKTGDNGTDDEKPRMK